MELPHERSTTCSVGKIKKLKKERENEMHDYQVAFTLHDKDSPCQVIYRDHTSPSVAAQMIKEIKQNNNMYCYTGYN